MSSFQTYEEFSKAVSSEKLIIALVQATGRVAGFTSSSPNIYSVDIRYVLTSLKGNGQDLTSVNSLIDLTSEDKYYYDFLAKRLYVYNSGNVRSTSYVATYTLHFSSGPLTLSSDLQDTSEPVIYEPLIRNNPSFRTELAEASRSNTITGSGALTLINSGGYFADKYDQLVFENQKVEVYSYNRDLRPSQAKKIFKGVITSKSYSLDTVSLSVKDDFFTLASLVPLDQFDDLVIKADERRTKRRVYGRVDGLRIQSLDQIGEGYQLSGVLSAQRKTSIIRGEGTDFISEVSPDDSITINDVRYSVRSVDSATSLTVSSEIDTTFVNQVAINRPKVPYYKNNRTYHVASHPLKRYSASITEVLEANKFKVDDANGFLADDLVIINGEKASIRRISFDSITLKSNLSTIPQVGDVMNKSEIQELYVRDLRISPDDYEILTDTETRIRLSNKAEFNQTPVGIIEGNYTFVEGSRKVWLGTPTFITVSTMPNVNDSLVGKFFTLSDEESTVAVWFAKLLDEALPQTPEPAHGASRAVKVTLPESNLTADQVAELVASTIRTGIYIYDAFRQSTALVKLETVQGINLANGSAGTSGFTITKTKIGAPSPLDINLKARLSSRDWIKPSDLADNQYLEILEVLDKSLVLREQFSESDRTSNIRVKSVAYTDDSAKLSVSCYGKTKDNTSTGDLVYTAAEVALDLLQEAGYGDDLDVDSFSKASSECRYLVSLALPLRSEDRAPAIRDVINLLNQSVRGSLLLNDSLNLEYTVLDSGIDTLNLRTISEDEVISFSIQSETDQLSRFIRTNYRHQDVVRESQEAGSSIYTYSSDFVRDYIGSDLTTEFNLYLYYDNEAREMTERIQFYNSLSNTRITIRGPLSLGRFSGGERVSLDIKGLYTAKGSSSGSKRLGVITKVVKDGQDVELVITDLGNVFSRSAKVSSNSSLPYQGASSDERVLASYVTDEDGLIDNITITSDLNLIS